MPFTWVANRPQRRWSVSAPWSSRSTFSEPGSEPTRSVSRRAGTVVAPSVSILPGHPVGDADLEVRRGQLEAGVLGPQEDVGEHGQGAPAGDRPRDHREAAGQVLLHDREFHVGCLQQLSGRAGVGRLRRPASRRDGERAALRERSVGWNDQPIFSSRHHRHHAVDSVDARRSIVRVAAVGRPAARPWTGGRSRGWTGDASVDDRSLARGIVHTAPPERPIRPRRHPRIRRRRPRLRAVVHRPVVPKVSAAGAASAAQSLRARRHAPDGRRRRRRIQGPDRAIGAHASMLGPRSRRADDLAPSRRACMATGRDPGRPRTGRGPRREPAPARQPRRHSE